MRSSPAPIADAIRTLIEEELSCMADARVLAHVRALLVEPNPVMRDWNFGATGQQYACWSVLEHAGTNSGIAYCGQGFGPANPWGLVSLQGTEDMSMGMDTGWFPSFLAAYFESAASTQLPIWRVFQHTVEDFPGVAITAESEWTVAWDEVERLRRLHPDKRYHCGQSVYRCLA